MLSYNKDKQYMIEQDAKSIDAMVNQIVEDSTKEVDEYIENIKRELDVAELSISELNLILMKLCSYYYYLAKEQELVGVRQDIATIYEILKNKSVAISSYIESVKKIITGKIKEMEMSR